MVANTTTNREARNRLYRDYSNEMKDRGLSNRKAVKENVNSEQKQNFPVQLYYDQ